MAEVWKPIAGFGDLYEVSDHGRVRSHDRIRLGAGNAGSAAQVRGRVLRAGATSRGYLSVVLAVDSVNRTQLVHRLVAKTFVPNPLGLPIVNHRDGDQLNNAATNLEWCTQLHNVHHARAMGRIPGAKARNQPRSIHV